VNPPERPRLKFEAASAPALEALGASWAPWLPAVPAVLLEGPLGAGKTTLVRGMLAGLGVTAGVKSPSFDLVHPHVVASGRTVYHVDLYRLDPAPPPEELDVLDADGTVVVEWGAAWRPYFPDRWEITLRVLPNGHRQVTVEAWGAVPVPGVDGPSAAG
jgi:tRNA threonylcarbamoyladenosine biosynthesis protein TsaE